MNEQVLFDRLRYMDKLKSAGISEEHARAHADAMDEALRESVATQRDVVAVRHDIALLRNDIQIAVKDMTIRIGVASASIIGALATIKYFG